MPYLLTPEQLILRLGELYTLPAVALEVLALADDPSVEASALRQCFERDPALTAKVLRVVNSALFGIAHPVSDLNQAIALLGLKPLKLLVLGFALPQSFATGIEAKMLRRYWRFTLTKALVAREIAERVRPSSSDDAFLAGMLADLGLLVLIQTLGEPYLRVFDRVRGAQRDLCEVERHGLGFDHIQLTVHLLSNWGFAQALIDSISSSHPDDQGFTEGKQVDNFRKLTPGEVLHFADLTALFLCEEQSELFPELLAMASRRFGMSADALNEMIGTLETRTIELADSLGLELPTEFHYMEVLAEAHRQLVDVAAEVAADLVRPGYARPAAEEDLLDEVRQMCASLSLPASAAATAPTVKVAESRPRRHARTEPRTAANHPSESAELPRTITAAIAACRKNRWALSLLLVEADSRDQVKQSTALWAKWMLELERLAENLDHPRKLCLRLTPGSLALVLLGCDRGKAAELGGSLLHAAREIANSPVRPLFTVSIGAASVPLPSPNFLAQALVDSANRCLFAAKLGGNSLKSIEIF